jgi:NAD(P)-dependent dehydrogenase (short-subunit alcohol dehydrogenase family)
MSQRGRPVLVTGSSSGIGLETAVRLAEAGFRTYATMRDPARSGDLLAEAARRSVRVAVLPLDVTDPATIGPAVERVLSEAGPLYALVNNAGTQWRGYFEDLSDEEIRHVFETNVFGTMAVTRAVLPHMRQERAGRIVIVTSVGGLMASMALSAYCASKFALEGFGEALDLETRPLGIRVSLVEPAIINTPIWGQNRNVAAGALDPRGPYYAWFRASERIADRLIQSSPTTVDDVARAVVRAVADPRPRLRYLVGRRAGLVLTVRRYMPDALFSRLYEALALRLIERGS